MISKCILFYTRYVLSTGNFLRKQILASVLKKLLIWGDGRAREMHTENYEMSQTMFRFLHMGLWTVLGSPKVGVIHFG